MEETEAHLQFQPVINAAINVLKTALNPFKCHINQENNNYINDTIRKANHSVISVRVGLNWSYVAWNSSQKDCWAFYTLACVF